MDKEVQQLVEMVSICPLHALVVLIARRKGATATQARAALRQYKDVMQAAEKIFEGKFDDVDEERGEDAAMEPEPPKAARMTVCRSRLPVKTASRTLLQTPSYDDEDLVMGDEGEDDDDGKN